MRVEDVVARYPLVYHMAERGSWPSIREHGLLSTKAALDFYQVNGRRRVELESYRRPKKEAIEHPNYGRLILRDQKPLNEKRLAGCLEDGLTPCDWYEILNGKTFFWAERERLITLLSAHAYRDDEHDVLTVDTNSLLAEHYERAYLCHMNSGQTGRFAFPRGRNTFRPIIDYPAGARGGPLKKVVELVVEYSVPDIGRHVVRVERMRRNDVLGVIWRR